jgi:hypothetical protein
MYFYVAISFNSRLLLHNGHDLVMAVKGMLGKIATDSSGIFSANWRMLSSMQRAALVNTIHKMVPQLEGISEGEWVTDWFLKKYIDQRVADTKRPEKGEKKTKRNRKGKLVIVVNHFYSNYNHL